jgi:hypothetical protein
VRIYTDSTGGSYVNAIASRDGVNVDGHVYEVISGTNRTELNFQHGPVGEAGVNGMQNEQLLAVLIHRMNVLNKAFPCRENALAITKLEEATMWLEKRTASRVARGVEGKNIL